MVEEEDGGILHHRGNEQYFPFDPSVWRISWAVAFPPNFSLLINGTEEHENGGDDDDFLRSVAFRTLWTDLQQNRVSTRHRVTPENDFRSLCQWKEESLGYGEITEQAIFKILLQHIGLCRLQATPVQTMVDLGSGTGRVVLAAAIALSPFLKVAMGLEIVPELHTQALELQTLWNRKAYTVSPFDCESDDDSCKNQLDTATMATTRLDFQCVDFTRNTEWTKSADLVFMHCTVFEEALFVTACDLCVTVKPGTWIITVSRPLLQCFDEATVASAMPDGTFEIISELHLEMSWGRGRVFVQRKL